MKSYFCRMWNGISFSENSYLKTSPVSLQFNELISIQKALRMLPSIQTQNNLEWTLFWRNRLPPSSECLLKMQTVYSSETLLAKPHVILTYTTLCLFTTVKNWSKNLLDGSCTKKWIASTTLCSEPMLHDIMLLHFAPHLSYGLYCLVKRKTK